MCQWDNGDCYSGDFVNGIREGKGTWRSGTVNKSYDGEWSNGQYSGLGILLEENLEFRGDFDESKKVRETETRMRLNFIIEWRGNAL